MCESTCFGEPILIYTKGATINLYQILMNRNLPFSFIAASSDCYAVRSDLLTEEPHVPYTQRDIERFRSSKALKQYRQRRKKNKSSDGECAGVELYAVTKEEFLDLCDLFPRTAALLQQYCVEQVEHLSMTRQMKRHLHAGNAAKHYYRKNQLFMERRADMDSDLSIKVEVFSKEMQQADIERKIRLIDDIFGKLERKIYQQMQLLFWQTINERRRLMTMSVKTMQTDSVDTSSFATDSTYQEDESLHGGNHALLMRSSDHERTKFASQESPAHVEDDVSEGQASSGPTVSLRVKEKESAQRVATREDSAQAREQEQAESGKVNF